VSDFAFAREHFEKDFALGFAVLKRAIHEMDTPPDEMFELSTEGFSALLSGLKGSH
jgi:hypothetical protein